MCRCSDVGTPSPLPSPARGEGTKKFSNASLGADRTFSYAKPRQYQPQGPIRFPGFILQRVQFFHNLHDRPILLALARVDVAARRDVVVVLGDLLAGDDARILAHFLPRGEGVGDADDGIL